MAKKRIGIAAMPKAAAKSTTFNAVPTVGLTGPAARANVPARSRIPIATLSAMMNPRSLLRRRELFRSDMLETESSGALSAIVGMHLRREARAGGSPPEAVWRLNSGGGCEPPEERCPAFAFSPVSERERAALG